MVDETRLNFNVKSKSQESCIYENLIHFIGKLSGLSIGQQAESNAKENETICGYFLKNLCANGNKCQSLHPPYLSPYCWYYQIQGENEVSLVSQEISDEIEKAFQDVNKNT